MQRNKFLKLRVSTLEIEQITELAKKLNVTISQLIRDVALSGSVKVSLEKSQVGYEFRKFGATLKRFYASNETEWTASQKAELIAQIQNLREKADQLEAVAMVGQADAHS